MKQTVVYEQNKGIYLTLLFYKHRDYFAFLNNWSYLSLNNLRPNITYVYIRHDVNIFVWPLCLGKQQIEKIDAALRFGKI